MAAATVGAVGEGAGARLGLHHPPPGPAARPPRGAGARRQTASGGRPASRGGGLLYVGRHKGAGLGGLGQWERGRGEAGPK